MGVKRSQRAFVGVTLTTVFSIAFVLMVYATLLGTIPGGNVVVQGFTGSVWYSLSNVSTLPQWTSTLDVPNVSTAWYAKMNTSAGGYSGTVTINWKLEKTTDGGSTWSQVGSATQFTFTLDGTAQQVYATADGTFGSGNRDWHLDATTAATYRVYVTVTTTT